MKIRWKRAAAILLTAAMLPFENVADCFVLRAQAAQYTEAESVLAAQGAIDGQDSVDGSSAETEAATQAVEEATQAGEEAAQADGDAAQAGEEGAGSAKSGAPESTEQAPAAASESAGDAASENVGTEMSRGAVDANNAQEEVTADDEEENAPLISAIELSARLDDCGIAQLMWTAEISKKTEELIFRIYRNDELYKTLEEASADDDGYFRFADEEIQGGQTYRYKVEGTAKKSAGSEGTVEENSVSESVQIETPQALVINNNSLNLNKDLVVFSLDISNGNLNLGNYKLKVLRDYRHIGGSIDINNGQLICGGNVKAKDASIHMSRYDGEAYFYVGKNFEGEDLATYLSYGAWEVKGDFSIKGERRSHESGYAHAMNFSGEKRQNITIEGQYAEASYYCMFCIVNFWNTGDEGIYLNEPIDAHETHQSEECLIHYTDMGGEMGWTLQEDQVYEGDLVLSGGTLDLNGHQLTVKGNLYHPSGEIYVHGGKLNIDGDYRIQSEKKQDGEVIRSVGQGILRMDEAEDYVKVGGDFAVENASFQSLASLYTGTMEVCGDVEFIAKSYETRFEMNDDFTLLLSGSQKQTFRYNNIGNDVRLNHVTILNASEEGIEFDGNFVVKGHFDCGNEQVKGSFRFDDYASAHFAGDYTISSPTYLYGDFIVDGNLTVSESANLYGKVRIGGNLILNEYAFFYLGGDAKVGGDVIQTEVYYSTLDIGGRLEAEGNLNASKIYMSNSESYLGVGGDFFYESQNTEDTFLGGTLEVKGDFLSKGGFHAANGHRLLLSGDKKQFFSAKTEDTFSVVELSNTSSDGVYAESFINCGELIQNDSRLTYAEGAMDFMTRLEEDTVVEEDLILTDQYYDLNGHELHITGNLIQQGGQLLINGGKLIVDGDYRIQTVTEQDGQQFDEKSSGKLLMNDESDYVLVKGSLYIHTDLDTEKNYTAGVLEVQGDLTVNNDSGSKGYFPTGSHKLLLSGNRKQTIKMNNSDAWSSHVNHLEIMNTSQEGVVLEQLLYACGEINDHENRVQGDLKISPEAKFVNGHFGGNLYTCDGYMEFNEDLVIDGDLRMISYSAYIRKDLTVKGNCYIQNDTYLSGKLTVGGTCRLTSGTMEFINGSLITEGNFEILYNGYAGIKMEHEGDYVLVKGNAEFHPYAYRTQLRAGTIEVKGNFASRRGMNASGTHRFVLSGDKKQTATAVYSATAANLEVRNTAEEGVEFIGQWYFSCLVNYQSRMILNERTYEGSCIYVKGWTLNKNERIEGDLCLLDGGFLTLNGYTLEVTGEVLQDGGSIYVENGELKVAGDFIQEAGTVNVGENGLVRVNGDYRIQSRTGEGGAYRYGRSEGRLMFLSDQAYVKVEGDFLQTTGAGDTYYDKSFTRGTLEVGGDVIIDDSYAEKVFYGQGSFTLILSGTRKQILSLGTDEASQNRIQNLILQNTGEDGVEIRDLPPVYGTVRTNNSKVDGCIRITSYTVFEDDFGGSIYCNDNLWGTPLSIGGDLILAGGSYEINRNISVGGNLRLENGANYTIKAGTQVNVAGDAILRGSLTDKGSLTVGGNMLFEENGALQLQSGKAEVSGDLTLDGFGYLKTNTSDDYLLVGGNVLLNSDVTTVMSYGTCETTGDFIAKKGIRKGNCRFVFSGDRKQKISLPEGMSFYDAEFSNLSEEGIELENVTVDHAVYQWGSILSGEELKGNYEIRTVLTKDLLIEGDYLLNGYLDLNGHTVTVKGDLVHRSGDLFINGGRLIVEGNYSVQITPDAVRSNEYSYKLRMEKPEDYMLVGGDIYIGPTEKTMAYYASLTDGRLEVKGNIEFARNSSVFQEYTGSKHSLILSGDRKQTVTADYRNYLNNLVVKNSSEDGIELSDNIILMGRIETNRKKIGENINITGRAISFTDHFYDGDITCIGTVGLLEDLTVSGNLNMNKNASLSLNDAELTVEKDVSLGGVLYVNKGKLTVGGDFFWNGAVYMTEKEAYLHVKGSAKGEQTGNGNLKKGVCEIGGDYQSVNRTKATDGHKFIFSGTKKQVVTLGESDYFENVELRNHSEDGVVFNRLAVTDEFVPGDCHYVVEDSDGTFGWTLEEDMEISGDLVLCGGVLDLNGHRLTVNGNLLQKAGNVSVHGGKLVVQGDYILEQGISTGRITMDQESDSVLIYGKFVCGSTKNTSVLKCGTLEIKGDLEFRSVPANPDMSGLTMIFSGEENQLLYLPFNCQLGSLINRSKKGLKLDLRQCTIHGIASDETGTGYYQYGDIVISSMDQIPNGFWGGGVCITGEDTLEKNINLYALTVSIGDYGRFALGFYRANVGRLTVKNGILDIQEGILNCESDFEVINQGILKMQDEEGRVFVKKNFTQTAWGSTSGYLTAGIIEISGDFKQSGDYNFVPAGTHTVIMAEPDGDQKQTVSMTGWNCKFHKLILRRQPEHYNFNKSLDQIADEYEYIIEDKTPPSEIDQLKAKDISETSVTLVFGGAQDESGISEYEIWRDGEKIASVSENTYVDSRLRPDTEYSYQVYAVDNFRNKCTTSPVLKARTRKDLTAPDTPVMSLYSRAGSSVILQWTGVTDNVGVTGYRIYRDGRQLAVLPAYQTQYHDKGLTAEQIYHYQIEAFDAAGNVSGKSEVVHASVYVPQIIRTEPKTTSDIGGEYVPIKVFYRQPDSRVEGVIEIAYCKVTEDDTENWIPLTRKALKPEPAGTDQGMHVFYETYNWDISDMTGYSDYKLHITITDRDGEKAVKEVLYHVDRQAPAAPGNVNAFVKDGTVYLNWDASVSGDCAGYRLYRKKAEEPFYHLLTELTGRYATTYTDSDVKIGETYDYVLDAADGFRNISTLSDSIQVLIENDTEPPVVKKLQPESGERLNKSVTLKAVAADNRKVARGIFRYRAEGTEEWTEIAEVSADKDGSFKGTWDTTGLQDGYYYVSALAIDESDNVSESFARRYEVDNTGIAKIVMTDVKSTATEIQLIWEDAQEPDFKYFSVEQKKDNVFKEIAKVDKNHGYNVGNLAPSTEYTFRVAGYDKLGNKGEYSEEITCFTKPDTNKPVIQEIWPVSSRYNNEITLKLRAKDDAELSDAEFSYSRDGENYTKIAEVSPSGSFKEYTYINHFDISKMEEGELYIRFRVRDKAGNGNALTSDGEEIVVRYTIDHTAPGKVQNLRSDSTQGYVGILWDGSEEKDIAAYRIYRSDLKSGPYKVLNRECRSLNFYDNTSKVGETYWYKVSAVDLAGNEGECSESICASTEDDKEAPVITGMSPVSGGTVGKDADIKALATDISGIRKMTLEYRKASEAEENYKLLKEFEVNDRVYLAETVWYNSDLEEGDYVIRATAEDVFGNVSAGYESTYRLDLTPPDAPVLRTRSGNYRIELEIGVKEAEQYVGFEIQRRAAGENRYTLLHRGEELNYTDTEVLPAQIYLYRVGAYDASGNIAWSEETEGVAKDIDDIAPSIVIPDMLTGLTGMELTFDAGNCFDNKGIAQYRWDFGDGSTSGGVMASHAYPEAGTYTARLYVTDDSENSSVAEMIVKISDRSGNGVATVRVVTEDGKRIPYAYVYSDLGDGNILSMRADKNGELKIAAAAGRYKVAAYNDKFLPGEISISISELIENEYEIELVEDKLIIGELTVRRMTPEELKEAGVDFSDPENYHHETIYFNFTYDGKPYQAPVNPDWLLGRDHSGPRVNSGTKMNLDDGTLHLYCYSVQNNQPVVFYVKSKTISWLKEMFEVKLGILNNADEQFYIQDSSATLQLPIGISLAKTTNGQSMVQGMGTISGQQKKEVTWIVKADKGGDYKIHAYFTGQLMPFDARVSEIFEADLSAGDPQESKPKLKTYSKKNFPTPIQFAKFEKTVEEGPELGKDKNTFDCGDPVNPNIGNFYVERRDAEITDIGGSFDILRRYNSKGTGASSMFGYGWSFDYDEHLGELEDESILYFRADGSILTFKKAQDGSYSTPEEFRLAFEEGEEGYTICGTQDGVRREFDLYGNLTAVYDLNGNKTTLTYDEEQKLQSVSSPSGKTYLYELNEDGTIQKITLPDGGSVQYTYNEAGDLIQVTYPAGSSVRYEYDGEHRMTARYDENGDCQVANVYDAEGRVVEQKNANDIRCYLSYEDGRTISTDNNGNITVYLYDSNFRTTGILYPDGTSETRTYNEKSDLTSSTDRSGQTSTYAVDDRGNVLSETRSDGAIRSFAYNDKNQLTYFKEFDGAETFLAYDEKYRLVSVKDALGGVTTYTYDDANRPVSQKDAAGNESTYAYEGANVTKMTDALGNTWSFAYDAMNRFTSVTDPKGHTTKTAYNERGWRIRETDAENHSTVYTYDPAGLVTAITDKENAASTFTYDKAYNLLTAKDARGNTLTDTYDANGNLISETDAQNQTVRYTYDAMNRITAVTDAKGNTTAYTYNSDDRITAVKDRNGNTRSFTYDPVTGAMKTASDAEGNVTSYETDCMGRTVKITNPDGTAVSYTYDALGRAVSVTDETGLVTFYDYDADSNVLQIRIPVSEEKTLTYRYEYDALNRLVKSADPAGSETLYTYDAAGNLTALTDAQGRATTFAYDSLNRLESAANALKDAETYAYDKEGRLLSYTAPGGGSTGYTYDSIGQLMKVTDALGSETAYTYDAIGRLTKITDALKGEQTCAYDADGNLTFSADENKNAHTYELDPEGQLTADIYPDGSKEQFAYDKNGRIRTYTDRAGVVTTFTYDAMGRVKSASDTAGNKALYTYDNAGRILTKTDAADRTVSYSYDRLGRCIRITAPDGAATAYAYDDLGRVVKMTNAEGAETLYTYDKAGNLLSKTEPGNAKTTYAYDDLYRLIRVTDPEGHVTEYTYDKNSNITAIKDANGVVTKYAYDALNRVSAVTDGNGNTTAYTYDALSRVLTVTTPEGIAYKYTYDAAGNLLTETDGQDETSSYTYDALNRLIAVTLPEGGVQKYTYDPHDLVTSVTDPMNQVTLYERNANGQVEKQILPNRSAYSYEYDEVQRLKKATTPLGYEMHFAYSAGDDLLAQSDNLGRTTAYAYDIMHRLTTVTDAQGGVTSYTYDERGNALTVTDPLGGTYSYEYDKTGNIISVKDPQEQITKLLYDKTGNLTQIQAPGERTTTIGYDGNYNTVSITDPMERVYTYTYDRNNRLTAEINPLGETTSYTYDAASRLSAYTDRMGRTQHFAYDKNGNLTGHTDALGQTTSYAYDAKNRLTAVTDAQGSTALYTYDVMDNLTDITDYMGRGIHYTYDAEGRLTAVTDENNRTEKLSYDIAGRLTSYTFNSGKKITYDYDKLDNLIEKSYADAQGNKNAENVTYSYNTIGERTGMNDESGKTVYTYDELGRLTQVGTYRNLDQNGAVNTEKGDIVGYEYNEAGEISALLYPDGTKVTYDYDKNGNLVKVTDREGKETTYEYDLLNRLLKTTRSNGTVTEQHYDKQDRITAITNRKNNEAGANESTGESNNGSTGTSDGTATAGAASNNAVISSYEYTYDERGFITKEVEKNVEEKEVTGAPYLMIVCQHCGCYLDLKAAFGNLYQEFDFLGGSHPGGRCRHCGYWWVDGKGKAPKGHGIYLCKYAILWGRRTETESNTLSTTRTFTYDATGKLTASTEKTPDGSQITNSYTYDLMGNRTGLKTTDETGKVLLEETYKYNASNQLIERTAKGEKAGNGADGANGGTITTCYVYDGDGNLIKEYDPVTVTKKKESDKVKSFFENLFGKGGNSNETVTTVEEHNVRTYSYDVENRLAAVREGGRLLMAAAYDGDGNRVFELNYNPEVSEADSLKTVIPAGKNKNGTFTTAQKLFEDELAELTSADGENYELISYINDVNREFTQVLAEQNVSGNLMNVYTYGMDRLSIETYNNTKSGNGNATANANSGAGNSAFPVKNFYIYDGRGSVSELTGMTGTVTAKYRYDDFGKLKEIQQFNTAEETGKDNGSVLDALGNLFGINKQEDSGNEMQNPGYHEFFAYNAESYNPNTEMQYLRARYYKPETANFLTEDSYLGDILKPLTLNRYNYCAGNPVNYKDPSGNVILAVELAKLGAAIGAVKGLCDAVKDAVEVGVDCYQNNKNFFEEYNWAAEGMHILNSTVSGAVAGGTLGMTGNLELSMAAGEASYELLQGLTDVSTGAEDTKDLKNVKDVAGYLGKRVVKGAIRGAAEGALFDISLAAVNPVPISSALKMAFAGGYTAVGAVGMNAAADGRSVSDSELLTAAVTGAAGGYMVAKIGEGIQDKITDDANAGKNMREKAKVYDPLPETDVAQRTGTTNQKIIDQSTGKNTGNNNLKEDVNVAQDAGNVDECPNAGKTNSGKASGSSAYKGGTDVLKNNFVNKIKEIRAKMPNTNLSKRGNMAVADVDIPGVKDNFVAHSKINAKTDVGADVADFSYLKPENERIFTSYVDDQYPRYHDTEVKILEDIASQITDPNVSGTINLYSELPCCQSCTNIILEFRRMFQNIKLNIFVE